MHSEHIVFNLEVRTFESLLGVGVKQQIGMLDCLHKTVAVGLPLVVQPWPLQVSLIESIEVVFLVAVRLLTLDRAHLQFEVEGALLAVVLLVVIFD